jgi:hypothetical protein
MFTYNTDTCLTACGIEIVSEQFPSARLIEQEMDSRSGIEFAIFHI